jgi:hypothetical protein
MEQGFDSSAEMDDFGLTESRVRKSLPHDPSSPRFILSTAETQYKISRTTMLALRDRES